MELNLYKAEYYATSESGGERERGMRLKPNQPQPQIQSNWTELDWTGAQLRDVSVGRRFGGGGLDCYMCGFEWFALVRSEEEWECLHTASAQKRQMVSTRVQCEELLLSLWMPVKCWEIFSHPLTRLSFSVVEHFHSSCPFRLRGTLRGPTFFWRLRFNDDAWPCKNEEFHRFCEMKRSVKTFHHGWSTSLFWLSAMP